MAVYGGSAEKKKPSNLSRIFDVISRGQYASAEGVRRLAKGQGPSGFVKGAASGLAGKSKTSYGTVLREHGVKGPLGAIGGFVGDVALDPTTYLTLGTSKVATTGGKALAVKLGGKEVAKTTAPGTAYTTSKKVAAKTAKTVGGSTPVQKVARVLGTQGKGAGLAEGSRTVRKEFGRTFNPGHGLTPEIHALRQQHHGFEAQRVATDVHSVKLKFNGTSKAHRERLGYALRAGTVHTLSKEDQDLVKYAAKMMGIKKIRKTPPAKVTWHGKPEDIAVMTADKMIRQSRKEAEKLWRSETKRLYGAQLASNPELRRAVEKTTRVFSDDDALSGYFVKHFDKIQNMWKVQATVLNPGHHVRNLMGDTYMNWIAGVRSANAYKKASKLVADHYPDSTLITLGGKQVTKQEVKNLYFQMGLKSGYLQSEGILREPSRIKTVGKTFDKIMSGTDKREDFTRFAHFVDVLNKQMKSGKSIDKAAEVAAARVRKYNFDYADLTARERKYLKRVVPFYTYMRKSLPRHLEIMFTQPGKLASVNKGGRAISQLLGVEPEDGNPLPGLTEALPPWYEDKFSISANDNKIIAPSLPLDIIGDFSKNPADLGKEFLGRTGPLLKAPVELATQRSLDTGFKVTPREYLPKQLTYPRLIQNQLDKEGQAKHQLTVSGKKIDERVINQILGIGVHRINPPPAKKKGSRKKGHKIYGT